MPRLNFVKKARKNNPRAGVKAGESYYWWANRMPGSASGVKRFSKTRPEPWQLLPPGSFGSTVGELEHRLGQLSLDEAATGDDATDDAKEACADSLKSEVAEIVGEIRSLGEEQTEKRDNMPEGLQQGDTGQLLEDRAQAMEDWADELEQIDIEADNLGDALVELHTSSPSLP